jgi:hypothetical protein
MYIYIIGIPIVRIYEKLVEIVDFFSKLITIV